MEIKEESRLQNSRSSTLFQRRKSPQDLLSKLFQCQEMQREQESLLHMAQKHYRQLHLPKILESFKETAVECDVALQAMLLQFVTAMENVTLFEAEMLCPMEENGLPY